MRGFEEAVWEAEEGASNEVMSATLQKAGATKEMEAAQELIRAAEGAAGVSCAAAVQWDALEVTGAVEEAAEVEQHDAQPEGA